MPITVYISPNAGPDIAAVINDALHQPDVATVVLDPGVFMIDAPIFVPSNKTLMGSGRDSTTVRATSDFMFPNVQQNALVVSEDNSVNVTLSDFSIDVASVSPGGLRLNGVLMRFTEDFQITRVDVSNATGYAHYAVGNISYVGGPPAVPVSGLYDDIRTYNSQVHFEQYFADGITLSNIHARDGDGTISTEAYFHPIVGSRNITYEHVTAIGKGFLGYSLISTVQPLENISIIDSYVELYEPSTGSALISLGNLPVNGLYISDSSFISHDYIAFRIGGVTGTATNSYFQGGAFGAEVTTSGNGTPSNFVATDSTVLGIRDATSGFGVAGVHSDQASYLTWNGGRIEARAGVMFPISGSVTVSPTTQVVRTGHDSVSSYIENASGVTFLASESFGLQNTIDLDGATLNVRHLSRWSTSDTFFFAESGLIDLVGNDVLYCGNVIGTAEGGNNGTALKITFNAAATPTIAEAILDAVSYRNSSDAPLTKARLISAVLNALDGTQKEVTASMGVVAVDDPTVAAPDIATGTESQVLILNLLSNDIDPDQKLDTVTSINGVVRSIGDVVTLASGATVTLLNSTQVAYDSNGVFDALSDPTLGIGFSSVTETFSYALSNNSSASVSVNVIGETSPEDFVLGDNGANHLIASMNFQALLGFDGADTLDDGSLRASLNGGNDNDVYVVNNVSSAVVEIPSGGIDEVRTSMTSFTLTSNLEKLSYTGAAGRFTGKGHDGKNTITGGPMADFLFGYRGDDTLNGGAGNDIIDGGSGNDVLNGGLGGDVMIGGYENDLYYVDNVNDSILEHDFPGAGYDIVYSALASLTLGTGVENLLFSGTGNFTGTGNASGNEMMGSNWNDVLSGMAGNDRLIGFGGNDVLNGGLGTDLLQGGEGSDQLTGDADADRFRFDTSLMRGDVDQIMDFESGLDRIELSAAVFTGIGLGTLAVEAFNLGSQAGDINHRVIYDSIGGSLYFDADGNGQLAQVKFAEIAPLTTVTALDFFLI